MGKHAKKLQGIYILYAYIFHLKKNRYNILKCVIPEMS